MAATELRSACVRGRRTAPGLSTKVSQARARKSWRLLSPATWVSDGETEAEGAPQGHRASSRRSLVFPLPAQHFCLFLWARVAVLVFRVSLAPWKAKLVSPTPFKSDLSGSNVPPGWSSLPLTPRVETRPQDSLLSQLKHPTEGRGQRHRASLCSDPLSPQREQWLLFRKFTKSWRALSPNFPQSSCDLPPSPVGPAGRGGGAPISYTKQGPWTKGVTRKLTRKAESGAHFPRMY